jgi:chromosome segregation ATPase
MQLSPPNIEIINYKVDLHDEEIKSLRESAHKTNNNIIVLNQAMEKVSESIRSNFHTISQLTSDVQDFEKECRTRLKLVETKQRDDEIKSRTLKNVFKVTIQYWWIWGVIGAIIWCIDTQKLLSLMHSVKI